jgi:hypothetical protein
VYSLELTSPAGVPGTAELFCSGAPANATCVVTPLGAPLGTSTPVAVTVATGVTTTAEAKPESRNWRRGAWLAALLPVLFWGDRRRRRRWGRLLAVLVLGCLMVQLGCGAGRTIPPSGPTSPTTPITPMTTPSGTYTLVASATSAGTTQSVTLTLVVP